MSRWLIAAALFGFTGVAAGAFGAHALRALDADRLALWDTAARYHMVHAPVLLAVAWLASRSDAAPAVSVAGWAMASGIAIFSGSLYLLAASERHWLGAVTPAGGVLLLIGWLALAWHGMALVRRRRAPQ
jgi:uncharacterized membrane protein YgdD (TMEM256/DUF423 family)